jgi:hypothetical protein
VSRRWQTVAKQYADLTNEHVIKDLVDINFGNDEPAPPLKFSTHVDRRYTPLPTSSCSSMPARSCRIPEPEEYLRSEGGLPKPKDPNNPEDQPDDQADNEGDDEPTPPRPTARTRINTAMTVGERTLRRNPLRHEVKAAADWDAMEDAWSAQQASLVE